MNQSPHITAPASLCDCPIGRATQGANGWLWEWRIEDDGFWCSSALRDTLLTDEAPLQRVEDFLALVDDEDAPRVQAGLESCVMFGTRFDAEFRIRVGEESPRWFRAAASAVGDKGGRARFVSGQLVDVTAEHAAAEQAQMKERRLMQRERMDALDCLAGGIAHEFNNILQAVRGYVAFAMDEIEAGSQASDDLRQALSATDRAAALTRSLLDFARAEEPTSERYEIGDELSGLDALLRPVIGEHITFRTRVSDTPLIGSANSQELRQSLLNLCINSRDAMPDGGELLVSADLFVVEEATRPVASELPDGAYCRLMITDNGLGIPDHCIEKVFDPFFSAKEVGRGTGLGLATVYGFAQRSGGRVDVYSEAGRGATFSIYLPVEETPGMDHEPTRPELNAPAPHTVLLVEDDPQVREVGQRSLEAAGYRVLVASDGEAALETYVENVESIAAVVLDIVLPRLNGRRVFEEIRRLQSGVPVVFTTGFDPQSALGAEDGQLADMTIAKPYDRQQLLAAVKSLIVDRRAAPVGAC